MLGQFWDSVLSTPYFDVITYCPLGTNHNQWKTFFSLRGPTRKLLKTVQSDLNLTMPLYWIFLYVRRMPLQYFAFSNLLNKFFHQAVWFTLVSNINIWLILFCLFRKRNSYAAALRISAKHYWLDTTFNFLRLCKWIKFVASHNLCFQPQMFIVQAILQILSGW